MKRILAVTVLTVALLAPGGAQAHLGNSNYRDVINRVTPTVPGLSVQVLNFDNNLEIINRTGKTVVVEGYNGEPYGRILGDGTVQVNTRSPAYYLNQDRYAQVVVPPTASAKAPPQWTTVDSTGRWEWHDHRIHLFTSGAPAQVKDKSKTTKIFDWKVPIQIEGLPGAIAGTLFWHGQSNGFPAWALISLVIVALTAIVVVLRRQRAQLALEESAPTESGGKAVPEAW